NNLSCLHSILDDDPIKDGLFYWNLPVRVEISSRAKDIENSTVFITAIDNAKSIMNRLFELNPKHIVYPLNIF
ncbi:hypothetical protein ACFL7M_02915, partial [Thermodesulfobacteriota bacterium]